MVNEIKKFDLESMFKGWFIGNFEPSLFKTNDVEVGIKKYRSGDYEGNHYHKIGTEFTVIVTGEVEMAGNIYRDNDILMIEPGVVSDFRAITDVITVVVKLPGANDDKYIIENSL